MTKIYCKILKCYMREYEKDTLTFTDVIALVFQLCLNKENYMGRHLLQMGQQWLPYYNQCKTPAQN